MFFPFIIRTLFDLLRPERMTKVNCNIYDVINWETKKVHILPNITRSKGNQTKKLMKLMKSD